MKYFHPDETHREWHEPIQLSFWREGIAATRFHADKVKIELGYSYVGEFKWTEEQIKVDILIAQFQTAFDMGKKKRSEEIAALIGGNE